MASLPQPKLGAIASAAMTGLALLAIVPWPYATLGGIVANVTMCAIPFMVVVAGFWKGQEPQPIAGWNQPRRGLGLLGIAVVFAWVVYAVLSVTFGGSRGDTPFLAFGIILSIVVTFWLDVVFGGWPFTLIPNRLLGGVSLIVAAYLITALLLRTLDFSFFAGQTFYAGMDPAGPIPAWDMLVGGVSSLATIFLFLHFELWPLTRFPRLLRQPVLGLVWGLLILGIGIGGYLFGTRVLGLTPDTFLVTVPVPFMFGTVVVLTMFKGSLTNRLQGRVRSLVSAALAGVIGTGLAQFYLLLQPILTPDVPAASALDHHLWLASALLAVTFPLMAGYHDLFQLWPLATREDHSTEAPDPVSAGERN